MDTPAYNVIWRDEDWLDQKYNVLSPVSDYFGKVVV